MFLSWKQASQGCVVHLSSLLHWPMGTFSHLLEFQPLRFLIQVLFLFRWMKWLRSSEALYGQLPCPAHLDQCLERHLQQFFILHLFFFWVYIQNSRRNQNQTLKLELKIQLFRCDWNRGWGCHLCQRWDVVVEAFRRFGNKSSRQYVTRMSISSWQCGVFFKIYRCRFWLVYLWPCLLHAEHIFPTIKSCPSLRISGCIITMLLTYYTWYIFGGWGKV